MAWVSLSWSLVVSMSEQTSGHELRDRLDTATCTVGADLIPADESISGKTEVVATLRPRFDTLPRRIAVTGYEAGFRIESVRSRGQPAHPEVLFRR